MLSSRVTNSPGILMANQRAQPSSSAHKTTSILLLHLVRVLGYTIMRLVSKFSFYNTLFFLYKCAFSVFPWSIYAIRSVPLYARCLWSACFWLCVSHLPPFGVKGYNPDVSFLGFPSLSPCPVMAVYCVRVLGVAEARETFLLLQLDTKLTQRLGD